MHSVERARDASWLLKASTGRRSVFNRKGSGAVGLVNSRPLRGMLRMQIDQPTLVQTAVCRKAGEG